MTDTALAVRDPQAMLQSWSVDQVLEQIRLIQEVMKNAMRDKEHYGVIPGTQKPTLLKPGAEKLCLTFRFCPEYEPLPSSVLRDDFILHDIRCRLIHIPTGVTVGTGLGSCNSREDKYAWRTAARICPTCSKDSIIKGKEEYGGGWVCFKKRGGCGEKYADDDSRIESQPVGKIKNENIWNENNTLEKMACKRALVAAVLNATAASDIFTQDLEDTAEENGKGQPTHPGTQKTSQPTPPTQGAMIIPPTWTKGKDSKGKTIPHPHAGRPITALADGDLTSIMEGLRSDPTIPGKAKEAKYQPLLTALEDELERRIDGQQALLTPPDAPRG